MTRADIIASLDPRRWPFPYSPAEVESYEAMVVRLRPRFGDPSPTWQPTSLDVLEAGSVEDDTDRAELDGLLLTLAVLGRPLAVSPALRADPRLTAWERLVLAALEERAAGRSALMVASEIVERVRPDGLSDDREAVDGAIDALVQRGALARLTGGGFVMRWRNAA